jgi:hypothetical protein
MNKIMSVFPRGIIRSDTTIHCVVSKLKYQEKYCWIYRIIVCVILLAELLNGLTDFSITCSIVRALRLAINYMLCQNI